MIRRRHTVLPNRDEILKVLYQYKTVLTERYGLTSIGVFGSVARNEAREESDIDVVIQMQQPDLFYTVHIKEFLEEILHRPVDVVHYRAAMNRVLRKRIDRDAIYI
ncbi:MAG: nucleotidyltransferase domain-containing protein [Magnetococcales bacterium]|nr:nucleotidyltransferase domain-containing protein [Magnetococcales bacterium]